MILQTLLSPNERTCSEQAMYVHKENHEDVYDTYFNLFSLKKWRTYTTIKTFELHLNVQGSFIIKVQDTHRILHYEEFNHTNQEIILPIPYQNDSDCVWFSFEPKSDDAKILSGSYQTPEEPTHPIRLAIDICTFKREEYVKRNIGVLREAILDNPDCPIRNDVEIFIVDNGKTLNSFNHPHIQLFPNKNAGGSGGFTRGLMEINDQKEAKKLTHMIFMDDDAVLEPDSLIRTFGLLSYIKEEYKKSVISGAMLRLDLPHIQHESGGMWEGTDPLTKYRGLDLRNSKNVIQNEEIQEDVLYAAWWYACYPLEVATLNNLPIPFFLHMDDIEYGIRNNNGVILLNGICMWHEAFENKRGSMLSYYDIRNIMITNAVYSKDGNKKTMLKYCQKRILANALRYKYKDAWFVLRAVEDFFKGIDYFKSLDPEKNNSELSALGYKLVPCEELTDDQELLQEIQNYESPTNPEEMYDYRHKGNKWFYRLTANGWVFTSKKDGIHAYPIGIWPYALYRNHDIILFDPNNKTGMRSQKSYKELFTCLGYYQKIVKLMKNYDQMCQEYRRRFHELQTEEFWREYLKYE